MLTLCMIVRDEEANLPRVLESVRGLADEIVVVDTGSTDRTAGMAAALGARVETFPWRDDFAAARNHSLSFARGDWILVLDADDEFEREDIPAAKARLAATPALGIAARQTVSYPDGRVIEKEQLIFIRNRPELRYQFRVHERVPIDPAQVERSSLRVRHHGYTAELFPAKVERNRRLLEKMKQDDDPLARAAAAYYLGAQFETLARPADAFREYAGAVRSGLACEYRLYAVLHLARLSASRGDLKLAEDLHRMVLEANPGAIEACLGMADLCGRSGRRDEARVFHERARSSTLRILPYVQTEWENDLRARLEKGLKD